MKTTFTTESGNEYTLEDGIVTFDRNGMEHSFLVVQMKALRPENRFEATPPWSDSLGLWEVVEEPIEGRIMYLAGWEQWRTTTPVTSVSTEQ